MFTNELICYTMLYSKMITESLTGASLNNDKIYYSGSWRGIISPEMIIQ